ncbi:spore gernimation protein [Photobacterium sanctipauli]|uniref:Spore gernimation protein n=1 Tax=Photobacterium sanctipauli TaxID=1342794 RepID=A0A2T3NI81_9GAMM|nr:hypothetical protein [Photobacterium sanctipauli]PSW14738.1 spore gernimation protein [Photobacterium sanctipauli]
MKQRIKLGCLGACLIALVGCNDVLDLTTTPVKNVEKMNVEASMVDVYCVTGICQFELAANQETQVTVNMHYSDTKVFEKIEGVSVTGETSSSVGMVDGNTFELTLAGSNKPALIQVVDYYRN